MSSTPLTSTANHRLHLARIQFSHFRALDDTTLDTDAFNLLIGANGSGKSTVIAALRAMGAACGADNSEQGSSDCNGTVQLTLRTATGGRTCTTLWQKGKLTVQPTGDCTVDNVSLFLNGIRSYQWDSSAIAASAGRLGNDPASIDPGTNGGHFATALTTVFKTQPEAFAAWRSDFVRWFPEYRDVVVARDTIGIDLSAENTTLPLTALSEGTLQAMATLLISHAPGGASLICIEEPDRAIAPRLFGDLRDALYRLAFPDQFDLSRTPIQIITTTHSPYLIDLFKDCPEQIRITSKDPSGHVRIRRLTDDREVLERIGEASLGEVWFSGILDA